MANQDIDEAPTMNDIDTKYSKQGVTTNLESLTPEPEVNEETNSSLATNKDVMKYNRLVPFFFRHDNEPEATGYAMIAFNTGSLVSAAIFFGTGLLDLARAVVGCEVNDDESRRQLEGTDDNACDKVYGIAKPTSLLTIMAIIAAVGGSIMLPFLGSIVDHTRHRRTVGRWSAFLLIVLSFSCLFVSEKGFPVYVIIYILIEFSYLVQSCVSFAYLPDLTKDPDKMAKYQARFYKTLFLSFILNTLLTTGISIAMDVDELGSAVIAEALAFVSCALLLTYSWKFLMQPREALKEVPEGSSLITTGFRSLWDTFVEIAREFPALKYFLFMVMFSEGALASLIAISATYMETVLKMSSVEIGIAFLAVLLAAVPGTSIASYVTRKYNPFRSILVCLILWIVSTVTGALVLTGRDRWLVVYAYAAFWGVCFGWLYPANVTALVSIIPKGRDNEFMGLYIFSGVILNWLPSLFFTILNENDVSMSLGLASLNAFFVIAIFFLFLAGSHENAVKKGLELS